MRAFLLSTLFFALSIVVFSQEDICGTFIPEGAPDPNRSINLRQSQSRISSALLDNNTVITIPVVFHICHIGEDIGVNSNVSDEDILGVLATTNAIFRKEESSGNLNDPLAVDTKIQFELASVDPNGNPTSGILRHDLSSWPFYQGSGIYFNSDNTGAIGIQDAYHYSTHPTLNHGYINIWVVRGIGSATGSGIAGFAYVEPTEDLGHEDGVVLWRERASAEYTTLAHELGHYLNLLHVFQSSGDCIEDNCDVQGDGVCDTPVQRVNPNCLNIPSCFNDDNRNIMGYGFNCRRRLTAGQAERIKLRSIAYFRPWILEASGISFGYDYDLSVYAPDYQREMQSCLNNLKGYFVIKNVGSNTITSFYITLRNNSGEVLDFVLSNQSLDPWQSYVYQFNRPNNGETSFSLEVIPFSNGEYDLNPNNNQATAEVNIMPYSKILTITENLGYLPNIWREIVRPAYEVNIGYNRSQIDTWNTVGFEYSSSSLTRSTCVPVDSCYSVNIYFDADKSGFKQPAPTLDYAGTDCIRIEYDGEVVFEPNCGQLSEYTTQVCNYGGCSDGYYAFRYTACNGEYSPSDCADIDEDGLCDVVDPCIGSYDACGVCNGPGAVYECGCSDIQAGNCGCCGLVEDAIGECGGTCQSDTNGDGICDD